MRPDAFESDDVEHLGKAAHGQLAVPLQHPHHVEMAHAHAGPNQLLAADAAKLAHRSADVGDDVANSEPWSSSDGWTAIVAMTQRIIAT